MILPSIYFSSKIAKKQAIKVITGLSNFKIEDIVMKIQAAELKGATYVDFAAHPDIVSVAKSITILPICASSINPIDLYSFVLAGADLVEIGNFDALYSRGIFFSRQQILDTVYQTKKLLGKVAICATIPHTFSLTDQIKLAVELEILGVDILQTEGRSSKTRFLAIKPSKAFTAAYKASSTISSVYTLSNYVCTPVLASSGLDYLSAPIAMNYGASIIGVSSALNQFRDIDDMAHYIQKIVTSLNLNRYKSKQFDCTNDHNRDINKQNIIC